MATMSNRFEALATATFLVEALGLDEEPDALVGDLVLVGENPPTTTLAVELGSADGPVAFLVYVYELERTDETGATGRELFDRGMTTLVEVERVDAPGPRVVASGEVGPWGLLLATTPTLSARLGGMGWDRSSEGPGATASPPTTGDPPARAEALLGSLRETNRRVEAYLSAPREPGQRVAPEEAELALYLTDGRSLAPLLTLIRRIVEGAETGE